MNRTIRQSLIGIVLTGLVSTGTGSAQAAGAAEGSADRWNSELSLYLWASSLKGTTAIGGNEVQIDESFSDIVEHLAGAFSVRFESYKGNFGGFLDGMYIHLDPGGATPAGDIEVDVKQWIIEGGGMYVFSPVLQALVGVRYQNMDLEFRPPRGPTASGDQDWADFIVGFRFVPLITDKWRLWLRGDVGMFGDSEFTWNAVIGARYSFSKKWSGSLAYRYLSNDYEKESVGFKYDVDQSGLGLIVGYSF